MRGVENKISAHITVDLTQRVDGVIFGKGVIIVRILLLEMHVNPVSM